jgi:hypothetical protein
MLMVWAAAQVGSLSTVKAKERTMRRVNRLIAGLLMVTMAWMPFAAQAGMVGTDQVVSAAQHQVNRDRVIDFLARDDVARQLQAFGLSADSAKERVAAMTGDEVSRLAGEIDALPAGADNTGIWIASLLIIGIVIYLVWGRR